MSGHSIKIFIERHWGVSLLSKVDTTSVRFCYKYDHFKWGCITLKLLIILEDTDTAMTLHIRANVLCNM